MASAANEWIFISYRRDDTAAQAIWLAKQLRQRFSGGAVFLDQQGIDWGVDFDKVLAHRVDAALVVLVLIGPKWLATLQDRAERVAQAASACDYVRMEVAAALARAGSQCMVLPLLCGAAGMPEAPALVAAGFDDLAGLCTKNGPNQFLLDPIDLAGQAGAAADATLARLCQRIDEAATQYSGQGDLSRQAAVWTMGIAAAALLNDKDLVELAARWQVGDVQGRLAAAPVDAIGRFGLALKAWNEDRAGTKLPRNTGPKVRATCLKLLAGLLTCTIDRVQAHRLASSGEPVPTVSPGLSAAAFRVGKGGMPSFTDDLKRRKGEGDFLLKRQLHESLDAPNAGALQDRQAQIRVRLHNLAIGGDAIGEKVNTLTPDQLRNLKDLLALEAQSRDGPFIISAVASGSPQLSDLRATAAALGVQPLAYTGEDALQNNLCFGDQIALRVAVIHCLDQIQEIR